jgi:hypothetical protein
VKPPKRLFKNRPPREEPDELRIFVSRLIPMLRDLDGVTDPVEIRAAILAYANDAFAEDTAVEIALLEVEPGVLEECGSTNTLVVMMFRDVCADEGLDWRDPRQQEIAFARIANALDAELAGPTEDTRALMGPIRRGKAPRDVPRMPVLAQARGRGRDRAALGPAVHGPVQTARVGPGGPPGPGPVRRLPRPSSPAPGTGRLAAHPGARARLQLLQTPRQELIP